MARIGEDGYIYKESGNFYTRATVEKYDAEAVEWARRETGLLEPKGYHFKELGIQPYAVKDAGQPGNLLVNVGIQQLEAALIATEQNWDATHTAIGVGNSNTAASAAQTDLQGASKRYNVVDSIPTSGSQVMTFISTFGTADANFAWEEWGVIIPDTGTAYTSGTSKQANYILLNRKVTSLGTKTSAQSWTLTVTITIA